MFTWYPKWMNCWTYYHKQRYSLRWTYTWETIKYLYSLGQNEKLLFYIAMVLLSNALCP